MTRCWNRTWPDCKTCASLTGMGREHLIVQPIPGKWSVLEVVCHLADTEGNIAHRIKRVLSEERPEFDRVQPDLLRAALAYQAREVEEELAAIDSTRRQMVRILRNSPAEAWSRMGIVSGHERTSAQMVNGAVEHLRHHLQFILEKRRALGLDVSGSEISESVS